jgi:predicted LPLAT superfamily acyltransferase
MKRWKAKAERGSATLIRLIAWLARTAGRPFCRALLYPIVLYFVVTDAVARRASHEFLSRVEGRPAGWLDVFGHIHSFAATLLDRVYMAGGEFDRFSVTIEGDALVHEALKAGKGCLLLGSHLGSFDLMMLANQALRRQPINVMMHFDPRSRVRRIAGIEDDKFGIIPLGRPDSFLRAFEVLQQGGIVAALADRVDGAGASLEAPFFGTPASFPLGPHVLAARAGAPVLMCFGLYEGGSSYRIEFTEFGAAADKASRGAMLQPVVQRYASLLERYARRYPKNWFNFYPYWAAR